MKKAFAVTAAIMLLCLGSLAQAAIAIDTVRVGAPGNVGDPQVLSDEGTRYGSVSYHYSIGKYEVTAGQYTAFLNVVAATDTYGLYNTEMSRTDYGSGITQSGASGSYTYTAASDFVNRPVNYVSFWDSCRFANWLDNGQGSGTETGAYTLDGYNGDDGRTILRNSGAKWAVASEDEWYKAAYYKGGGTDAGYWRYPTSSDTHPGQDMADASGNNANYYYMPSLPYPIDSGRYTTIVGEFQNSHSPYGTFDQGGNVEEWNETIAYPDHAYRVALGGSFGSHSIPSQWLGTTSHSPAFEARYTGFRVSYIPEPSSVIALAVGLLSLLGIRRRRA